MGIFTTKHKKSFEQLNIIGIDFEVKRSTRRKTISIKIKDSIVFLYLPFTLKIEKIVPLLMTKKKWIQANILEQTKTEQTIKRHFINGDTLLFFGRQIIIKNQKSKGKSIALMEDTLFLFLPDLFSNREFKIKMIQNWYRKQALDYITERVTYWKTKVGVDIRSITVRAYKSRWGSCDSNGNVKFNWKLIMAPKFVIEYVVVHELCHRIHMNHSILFWKLVELHFPEIVPAKNWLKENETHLNIS
jgi:predicted metal-dependent hydrolase